MNEKPETRQPTPEVVEAKLWEKADEISTERERLANAMDGLYREVATLRENPSLHDWEVIAKKEQEYWVSEQLLDALVEKEDRIQDYLIGVSEGTPSQEVIDELFPPPEEPKISKRKQKILEQREHDRQLARASMDPDMLDYLDRFGIDPLRFADSHEFGGVYGHNPNRLSTGKHATRIKGNINPMQGADRFFRATADTHGGKVRRSIGKKNQYVGKGGRKIRKK